MKPKKTQPAPPPAASIVIASKAKPSDAGDMVRANRKKPTTPAEIAWQAKQDKKKK